MNSKDTVHRAHPSTVSRTRALRHSLPTEIASLPVDAGWLALRTEKFEAASGIGVRLVLSLAAYHRLTGRRPSPDAAGHACLFAPDGSRFPLPVVFLNPGLLRDRGDAEQVLAHEFMHARWPSYGHKREGFERAQQLLDALQT